MESSLLKQRAFVEAAHQGNLTKAAAALGYTQSGISRSVAALESELGCRLLVRSRGGVTLTPEGGSPSPSLADACRRRRCSAPRGCCF